MKLTLKPGTTLFSQLDNDKGRFKKFSTQRGRNTNEDHLILDLEWTDKRNVSRGVSSLGKITRGEEKILANIPHANNFVYDVYKATFQNLSNKNEVGTYYIKRWSKNEPTNNGNFTKRRYKDVEVIGVKFKGKVIYRNPNSILPEELPEELNF